MDYRQIAKQTVPQAIIRGTIIVLLILLIIVIGRHLKFDPDDLSQMLAGRSIWQTAIIYIFLYVSVTFFVWLSKDVFRFIAAVLFGPLLSTLLVYFSEMINAAILFTLSRYLGKGFVDNLLVDKSRRLRKRLSHANLWSLFTLRAVPLLPFRFLDLGCGLTRIRLSQYLMVAALASPARIFWVQYILAGLGVAAFKSPSLLVTYLLDNKIAFIWSMAYLIMAALLAIKIKSKA